MGKNILTYDDLSRDGHSAAHGFWIGDIAVVWQLRESRVVEATGLVASVFFGDPLRGRAVRVTPNHWLVFGWATKTMLQD